MASRKDLSSNVFAESEKSAHGSVLEDVQKMAFCLGFLFCAFFVFNAIDFVPPVRLPMLVFDGILIVVFFLIGSAAGQGWISGAHANAWGALLAALTGANILAASALLKSDLLYTAYLGLTLIGVSAILLSYAWLAITSFLLMGAWFGLMRHIVPEDNLVDDIFILGAAITAAFVLLSNRIKAFHRLQQIRVFAADLLQRRSNTDVALSLGYFAALLTGSVQWGIQWASPSEGEGWVEGRGTLSKMRGFPQDLSRWDPGTRDSLSAGHPVIWAIHKSREAFPRFSLAYGNTRGVMAVPLLSKGALLGVLWLARRMFRRHDVSQQDLAETCAAQARAAFESVALLRDIQQLATTDELTGLFNRRQFFFLAKRECARRVGRTLDDMSVAMGDIDFFKKINDTYGHQAGDTVLKEVAQRIKNGLRESDVLGRYGGEEFSILLPNTPLSQGREVVERLRSLIAATPITVGATAVSVSISFGLSIRSKANESFDTLLAYADQALYRAKETGRNKVVVHEIPGPDSLGTVANSSSSVDNPVAGG